MISIYYDVNISFEVNRFSRQPSDISMEMADEVKYNVNNIGRVIQTKTFFGKKQPISQIRLNNIPLKYIEEIKNRQVYLILEIFQNGELVYKNYYLAFFTDIIQDSEINNSPEYTLDIEIYLQSIIINNLNIDKSFSKLSNNITDNFGYSKIDKIVTEDLPVLIKSTYGDAFNVKNFCSENFSTTAYKNLIFSNENTNMENINILLDNYKFTLNPYLYGLDEGYSGIDSTQLLIVDLLHPEYWYYMDTEVIEYLKNPEYRNQSSGELKTDRPYFTEKQSLELFSSNLLIKNINDNTIFKMKPIMESSIKLPKFMKMNNDIIIEDRDLDDIRNTILETNLSEKDFRVWLLQQYELYLKKPFFKSVTFTGLPYSAFSLGRRFPTEFTNDNSLVVGGDIHLTPIPNKNDTGSLFKPISEKQDPFKCSGKLFLLSY